MINIILNIIINRITVNKTNFLNKKEIKRNVVFLSLF